MIDKKQLYGWCAIKADELVGHKDLKVNFRMVQSSEKMGELMARDFVDEIKKANEEKRVFRAIVPCGPKSWHAPFTRMINEERVSLKNLIVFHMDECLD
jgi:glucosamine-6-phosphate deaminase